MGSKFIDYSKDPKAAWGWMAQNSPWTEMVKSHYTFPSGLRYYDNRPPTITNCIYAAACQLRTDNKSAALAVRNYAHIMGWRKVKEFSDG